MSVRSGRGDKGYTELSFRRTISKDSPETAAMGDLDELNSCLGLVKCKLRAKKERSIIEKLQHGIFAVSSEISVSTEKKRKMGVLLTGKDTKWICDTVERLEKKFPVKGPFHLPGSGETSAYLDLARSVARRAERNVVALFNREKMTNSCILTYLNCVSDVLFILARKKAVGERKVRSRRMKKAK